MEKILEPYIIETIETDPELQHDTDQKAILLIDCYPVHTGEDFRAYVRQRFPNVFLLFVPANCLCSFSWCRAGADLSSIQAWVFFSQPMLASSALSNIAFAKPSCYLLSTIIQRRLVLASLLNKFSFPHHFLCSVMLWYLMLSMHGSFWMDHMVVISSKRCVSKAVLCRVMWMILWYEGMGEVYNKRMEFVGGDHHKSQSYCSPPKVPGNWRNSPQRDQGKDWTPSRPGYRAAKWRFWRGRRFWCSVKQSHQGRPQDRRPKRWWPRRVLYHWQQCGFERAWHSPSCEWWQWGCVGRGRGWHGKWSFGWNRVKILDTAVFLHGTIVGNDVAVMCYTTQDWQRNHTSVRRDIGTIHAGTVHTCITIRIIFAPTASAPSRVCLSCLNILIVILQAILASITYDSPLINQSLHGAQDRLSCHPSNVHVHCLSNQTHLWFSGCSPPDEHLWYPPRCLGTSSNNVSKSESLHHQCHMHPR